MNRTLIIAMAATGLAVAGPVAAHHPSPMSETIETYIPPSALLQHNTMMDELEQGMATTPGNTDMPSPSGLDMDPADAANNSYVGPVNADPGSGEVIDEWDEEMGDFGPAREPLVP